MKVVIDPGAKDELRAAALYYEAARTGLAEQLLQRVEAALRHIAERPLLYRRIKGRFRRALVDRFPYGVIYVAERTQVYVVAVMHLSRNPGYWYPRILRRR